jgi:hypothetical protein
MKQEGRAYTSTRIWAQTRQRLKLIAALTGRSVVEVIDLLSEQELSRLEKEKASVPLLSQKVKEG